MSGDEIELEFTPLEFETIFNVSQVLNIHITLEFTPLEFETALENNKFGMHGIRIYSVGV